MYLKALEIQGFKSFPDKLRLSFEERICAVVGPNGSGKSNLSDAICWVLGEQRSKALRGSKMEDVLFGGTAERKEAGFAQVSLIFGNEDRRLACDADEVTLTRRYYRSGESEYFINKAMVRLKDIQQLIMDTGLGRDGYSLVGQGRADEILSAKSTERREIFEEAAGISKYRHQREEAETKLARASDALLRVGDKIAELELQREPLKRQADEAKRFLALRDELRGVEISLWLDELDKLNSENHILMEEYASVGETLEQAKRALEALYETSEHFHEDIRTADETAERLRAEITADEAKATELEREVAIVEADIKSNALTLRRLEGEEQHQHERENELKIRLEDRKRRQRELSFAAETLQTEQKALENQQALAEAKCAEAEENARRVADETSEAERACAAAEARAEAIRHTAESQQSRSAAADDERVRLRERFRHELAVQTERKTALEEQRQKAEAAAEENERLRAAFLQKRKRLEEASEALRQQKLREGAIRSRLTLLGEMEQEYEGFSKAVRAVMHESENGGLQHIHGVVAGLIQTEDRYTVAVETALGVSLQSIVVSAEEDGKAAIRFLKRHDAGRATFLPLRSIRGGILRETGVRQAAGVEGLASELVRFEEVYRNIVENLLGRTVVTDDLDSAIALSRQYGGRFRIVTLDGQVMNAGGSMTGGSAARNVGILSRSNEVKRLAVQHEALLREITESETDIRRQTTELQQAEQQADEASQRLRALQDGLLKKEAEQKQQSLLIETIETGLRAAEETVYKSEQDEKTLALSVEAAEQEITRQRERLRQLYGQQKSAEEERQNCAREREALSEKAAGLRARRLALEAEQRTTEAGIGEWEALLSGYGEDKAGREALRNDLLAKNRELRLQQSGKTERVRMQRERAEQNKPLLYAALEQRQRLEAQRTENERKAQAKNREIGELERQYAELGKRKLTVDLAEKQILDRLWDNYELSRTAAQQQRVRTENTQRAGRHAAQLRKQLAAMGSPNIGAIAEFRRIDERYAYLTDQRKDILKAKRELEQVIAALTAEMEKIFAREFHALAESFGQTFRELFGGGTGELYLEDPRHSLDCGIEIKVQPPGKSLKTLTLLSGGEKAFVAIALYFAMLKVRPAPFCVLDEIESALDEANVARFAKYLRTMTGHTQFICVTHRRGSMEEADMLYGVTMQKGISSVLRVALTEAMEQSEDRE